MCIAKDKNLDVKDILISEIIKPTIAYIRFLNA